VGTRITSSLNILRFRMNKYKEAQVAPSNSEKVAKDLDERILSNKAVGKDRRNSKLAYKPGEKKKAARISKPCLRVSVLLGLVVTALFFGLASYYVYSHMEWKIAESDFVEVSRHVNFITSQRVQREVNILSTIQTITSMMCPDANKWPNCSISFTTFEPFSTDMNSMGKLRAVSYAPLVEPEKAGEFEAFAYEFYATDGHPTLGLSNFSGGKVLEKGIYAKYSNGKRYHAKASPPNSANNILAPVFLIGNLVGNAAACMFDLYSNPVRQKAIDQVLQCVKDRTDSSCVVATEIVQLVQDKILRPAVLILSPIIIQQKLVGLGSIVLNWDIMFTDIVHSSGANILAVLSFGSTSYSYKLSEGQAELLGAGDHHDSQYSDTAHYFEITDLGGTQYTVTIYMTSSWANKYKTYGPVLASVTSVFVIFLTVILVVIYDYLMNKDLVFKEQLMSMKRDFVRYVSHEIRTPMNTVHLGLTVLKDEMSKSLTAVPEMVSMCVWVELIVDIEESTTIAIGILNDLINYDKISHGQLKLERSIIEIMPFLSQAVRPFLVRGRLSGLDVTLKFENEPDLKSLVIYGDDLKLQQSICNTISNACKFTTKGGFVAIKGKISTNAEYTNDWCI
jgi:signal transduction histidine kinase